MVLVVISFFVYLGVAPLYKDRGSALNLSGPEKAAIGQKARDIDEATPLSCEQLKKNVEELKAELKSGRDGRSGEYQKLLKAEQKRLIASDCR